MAMEDGETVSFTAVNTSTRATQDVDVTRGTAYYYACLLYTSRCV